VWHHVKEPIVLFFGISRDALHVHLGLVLFLIVATLFRDNPRRFLYAWIAVLTAETINELLDFHDWYHWTGYWNWRKSMIDYAHTLLWPSIFLLSSVSRR